MNTQVHMVFEILSYIIGYRFYLILRKKQTDLLNDKERIGIFISASFGALAGSKFLGLLDDVSVLTFDLEGFIIVFLGVKTIVGGLLGGLFVVEVYKSRNGIKYSSGDLMTYPLIVAMIIGRIGCHLTSLDDGTFGIQTNWLTCMDFGDGVCRHPTNLYEIFFLVCLGFGILVLDNKQILEDGSKFKLFMFGYLFFRFFIEFIKPRYLYFNFLSAIQMACLLGLFYYIYLFLTVKTFKDA